MKLRYSIAWIFFCIPHSWATNYFVRTDGNDSNNGLTNSASDAWLTIQKSSDVMVAGDTVNVTAGKFDEYVSSGASGTEGAPIIFDGGSIATSGGFTISHEWITIQNFELDGTNQNQGGAVTIQLAGSNIVIRHNIFDGASGLTSYVRCKPEDPGVRPINVNILSNSFLNNPYFCIGLAGVGHTVHSNYFFAPETEEDAILLTSSDTVISGNVFTNFSRLTGSGAHVDLIQGFANNGEVARDNIIENNYSVNCTGTQIGVVSDDGQTNLITRWTWRNNIWDNVGAAISLSAPHMYFYNNTFYQTGTNTGSPILFRDRSGQNGGVGHSGQMFNNIFVECGTDPTADWQGWWSVVEPGATNLTSDNNLVIGTGAGTAKDTNLFTDVNGINGEDPLFVSVANSDFHLQSGSPAIAAATNLNAVFTLDFDGVVRGDTWDCGVFEFAAPTDWWPTWTVGDGLRLEQ